MSNTDITFELRVSDGTNTSVDTVTVHVNADDDAPSADAGSDQTVDENAVVQLSGGGSDAEGQNLSYEWVQTGGPAVTLSDASAWTTYLRTLGDAATFDVTAGGRTTTAVLRGSPGDTPVTAVQLVRCVVSARPSWPWPL